MSMFFKDSNVNGNFVKLKAPEFCYKQFDMIAGHSQYKNYALCIFYDQDYDLNADFGIYDPKFCSWSPNWSGNGNPCKDYKTRGKEIMKDGGIFLPIFEYTHTGTTISLSPFPCQWDSGISGYVEWAREDIIKFLGVEQATPQIHNATQSILKGRIELYNLVISGEVYGYRIWKYNFIEGKWNGIDSCYGYLGELNEVISGMDFDVPDKVKVKLLENLVR